MVKHMTVPDFFQEETSEALRSQVGWLNREIGLDDAFLMTYLETDEKMIRGLKKRSRQCRSALSWGSPFSRA